MNEKPEHTTDETSSAASAPDEPRVQDNAATSSADAPVQSVQSGQPPAEVAGEAAATETQQPASNDSAPDEPRVQDNAATGSADASVQSVQSGQPPAEVAGEAAATETQQPASNDSAPPVARRRGRSGLWTGIVLFFMLLAGLAGGGWYFVYVLNQGMQAERAERQALLGRFDELQQGDRSLTDSLRQLDGRLTTNEQQITSLLRSLNNLHRPRAGAMDWKLAEVEHLLRVASQRLLLAADINTAQAVLQSVDALLMDIPDPALLPVREQLIADLNLLKSSPRADFSGLALTLAELAGRTNQLPLKQNAVVERAPAPPDPATEAGSLWRQFAGGVWQELKSLLVISRTDNASGALLTPRERYFLQRNLRLQLDAARLALLSRDQIQLRASVRSCRDWLNEFFDTEDEQVRNALESLDIAADAELEGPVLSINATLQAFDEYLTGAGHPAPGGAARQ